MDDDWDTALPPSATLANQTHHATDGRLDQVKRLRKQGNPAAPVLLTERNERRAAPKMLWGVGVGLLAMPMELDLWMVKVQQGFA